MGAVSLLDLRKRVRERADAENSQFFTDAELNSKINASAQELYDLLVDANQDYYTLSIAFTLTLNAYTLPSDFYKLVSVEKSLDDGRWIPLESYHPQESGHYSDADVPSSSYRIHYIPVMTLMSANDDTFDGQNGFEEYIVIDAAIKCLNKEESDPSALIAEKRGQLERVQRMATDRDFGGQEAVIDVRNRPQSSIKYRLVRDQLQFVRSASLAEFLDPLEY